MDVAATPTTSSSPVIGRVATCPICGVATRQSGSADSSDSSEPSRHDGSTPVADGIDRPGGLGVVDHAVPVGFEPLLFTVPDAGRVLGIGRSLAYKMASQYLASGGREGLPVTRLGRCLRVPRWALLELALFGRVVRLSELVAVEPRRLKRRRITVRGAAHARSGAALRPPSSRVSSSRRPLRSPGRRRVGSVEQLVLVPGG
jgi:hypothetical protein